MHPGPAQQPSAGFYDDKDSVFNNHMHNRLLNPYVFIFLYEMLTYLSVTLFKTTVFLWCTDVFKVTNVYLLMFFITNVYQ